MSNMKELPRRFLSLRDKGGGHHRSKSAPPGNKPRNSTSENFRAFFKGEHVKSGASKEDEAGKEQENTKVRAIQQRLKELGHMSVTSDHIRVILATHFAQGDPEKAVQFIDIEQKSISGIIVPYKHTVEMVGAENRGAVTCYLDSLLFSMFAKMDAFECILKNEFPADDKRNELVILLRIWVNMLRTGKLIHTDLTKLIQDSIADCGWADARELEQQDTSEAFAFLTETLQLPLLSLQVDLFHQGKRDKDDHKVVYERLLNLAIPPDEDGKGIKLEDCLEEYFNARVDVLRDSEEAKKSATEERFPSLVHRSTLRIKTEELPTSPVMSTSPVVMSPQPVSAKPPEETTESAEDSNTDVQPSQSTITEATSTDGEATTQRRPSTRARSTSVIQSVLVDDSGRTTSTDNVTLLKKARRKGSTVVKAVTIPAWQFFRLIPWHALSSNEPQNDVEVKLNFDQRPVVGICLKRYAMTETGLPKRHNTFIDIPDSLRLPRFMLADGSVDESTEGLEDQNELNADYKLVLQSVICHRGESVQSGHYIAFARVAPMILTDNRRHELDPPPDYEEAQWVMFDDLHIEQRVSYVDDIKESLKAEMPYLLFYQVVPMVDVASASADASVPNPPSYDDFKVSIELSTPSPGDALETPRRPDGYFGDSAIAVAQQSSSSKPPSIRLSLEQERPRRSMEGTTYHSYAGSTLADSRRQSLAFTDSAAATPAATPPTHSPVISPSDETTASRLSRAASRFAARGNRSRPPSQSGDGRDGRISMTMSRMAGLMMRPSKEPLADPSGLNISTSNQTGRASSELSREAEAESPIEAKDVHQPLPHNGLKHAQKNGKTKEKIGRAKTGDQPERECTVM